MLYEMWVSTKGRKMGLKIAMCQNEEFMLYVIALTIEIYQFISDNIFLSLLKLCHGIPLILKINLINLIFLDEIHYQIQSN